MIKIKVRSKQEIEGHNEKRGCLEGLSWTVRASVSERETFKINSEGCHAVSQGRTNVKLLQTEEAVCAKIPRQEWL